MRIAFTKMHGVGNDFVVFDAPADESVLRPERLRALGDRRTGVGFDQALVLERPRRPDTAVYYRIFNCDGDEVEQCGNGARCIAALLDRRGLARNGELTLDSPAGTVRARIEGRGRVSVDMGVPDFDPRSLPFEAPREADSYALEVAGRTVEIGAVSLGNPHAVLARCRPWMRRRWRPSAPPSSTTRASRGASMPASSRSWRVPRCGCVSMSVAPARHPAAAPAPARRSRWRAAGGC